MVLKARPLEPLRQHNFPAAVPLHLRLSNRVTEERNRLAVGNARISKLQTVIPPVTTENGGNGVTGRSEVIGTTRISLRI